MAYNMTNYTKIDLNCKTNKRENKDDTLTIKGRIIKGIGGFYYVDAAECAEDTDLDNKDLDNKKLSSLVFKCPARGKFRQRKITPLVGDWVMATVNTKLLTGVVDEILPRKNQVLRPPTANVTQMAVVVAAANPRPSLYLIDKLLASAEAINIDVIICINKTDIADESELCDIYQKAGYKVIPVCALTGKNIDVLKNELKDNTTVFAGNSGVGKSSILNQVTKSSIFETGEVSKKAERGKHTTRHTELVKLNDGGYIIDTPGFGTIDLAMIDYLDCAELFREFNNYIGGCRFSDCRHISEPDCVILNAVAKGEISKSRHDSYVRMLNESKKK